MSTEESRGGYTLIWLISCFLFISIAAGGGFLVMYMVLPESPSTSWLPLAGVTLVCLPWLFWFLTFFYRVISRACGFRLVCCFGVGGGGGGGGKGSGEDTNTGELGNVEVGRDTDTDTPAVVVMRDQNDEQGNNDESKQNSSSSNSSIGSRESEIPLAFSMQN